MKDCTVNPLFTNNTPGHEDYHGLLIQFGKVVCCYWKEQGKFGKYATVEEFDGELIRRESLSELCEAVESKVVRGILPKELSSWAKGDRIFVTFAGQKYYRSGRKKF